MDDDGMHGLSPDEIEYAQQWTADGNTDKLHSNRRVISVLIIFIVAVIPSFVGLLWAAEDFVYTPLCARQSGAPVVDVEVGLPATQWIGTDDEPSTCIYADNERLALKEVIAPAAATAVDYAVLAVALVLPFLLTVAIVKMLDLLRLRPTADAPNTGTS